MSERDELAEFIRKTDEANEWDPSPRMYGKYADAILAAGYRKPRTITTAEELDALPVESVVRSDFGVTWEKDADFDEPDLPWWTCPGDQRRYPSRPISLPATVLWEPK